jgi:hypothetical protein
LFPENSKKDYSLPKSWKGAKEVNMMLFEDYHKTSIFEGFGAKSTISVREEARAFEPGV